MADIMPAEPARSPDAYNDATRLEAIPWNGPRNPDGSIAPLGSASTLTCWAKTWRRGEISIAEADAQRDMRDRCVARLMTAAEDLRLRLSPAGKLRLGDSELMAMAAFADGLADELAKLEPRAVETGLDGRGA